ncbi:MAG: aspartate phosphatase [Bacillota bacterium]|uniref:Aspartate phosphatase n=1 Tax=Bacillus pumilus TaxID=1408 RepID=A0A2G8ITI9_BACPU|nr:aspartate phosphatase [Bacillus pumilus]PIK26782.1 aspartate phosphatase [Bacillus pumilus]
MKFKTLSVVLMMISVISVVSVSYFTSEVTASHDEARRGHTASIGYSA